ncbi:MAG TPA: hypothetical protein VM032_10405 [Vicinamibacterales bacterium]|nr:hypothetical protein [Vicinamibacterales bacterium]
MTARRLILAALMTVGVWWGTSTTFAQGPSRLPQLPEPFGDANEAVYPSFEGWGESQDGSGYFMVLGYKNRNRTQVVEVPVGPNNRIEPGGPDYGQPTVFYPGRQTTVFAIKVPKDFGDKRLTWTLVANGQQTVVTFYLNREYNMNLYKEDSSGNEPPKMKFAPSEPMVSGPTVGFAQTLTAAVGQPLPLKLWASDAPPTEKNWESILSARGRTPRPAARDQIAIVDGRVIGAPTVADKAPDTPAPVPDITVVWKKVRGPGKVTVTPPSVPLFTKGDRNTVVEANATASFSAAGEYVLRAEPIEVDDGFDGLCCFTFGNIKVTVK